VAVEIHEEIGSNESMVEAASTVEEAEETAWTVIEQYLQNINPIDLQKLVASLLAKAVVLEQFEITAIL
jgi:hypothetical protein